MNVSILQNNFRIQNVGILLGGCLTLWRISGGYSQRMMELILKLFNWI